MNRTEDNATVVERLKTSLEAVAGHNPNDTEPPVAVLWTDSEALWQPVIPHLRRLMPRLLTLGEYELGRRIGPSIWLRCAVESVFESVEIPHGTPPVLYLPGVARQDLSAAGDCPASLRPLVELQYRGVVWHQKNGRDWTVEAFLVSGDGGLGLDVARDTATRQSMLHALSELATTPVQKLRGRRLEAEDFDRLLSDDPIRDLLTWLSNPQAARDGWNGDRWNAFRSRCRAERNFDPDKDGELVAAERLGRREEAWAPVWRRFAEAPALYPGVPGALRRAKPSDLFVERSSWPQHNESEEGSLRQALMELADKEPAAARNRVAELEMRHGERRTWVWAKLDQAPLTSALLHLAELAAHTETGPGGATAGEMAVWYAGTGWKVDAAALRSMAAVSSSADTAAVSHALMAIYREWLELGARHLQALVEEEPLPVHGVQETADVQVEPGGVILFADGLRFDVAQRLVERLHGEGRTAAISPRWAALPTVTATAKPAVSPVCGGIAGTSPGEDFLPCTADGWQPLTATRFRSLLEGAGYSYLAAGDTGDPAGRAWTEHGELDKLGHSLETKLASRIDEQVNLLRERVDALLDAGWREVLMVTDHGWLWLPGGLPKVHLPKYLTETRWTRCAVVKGASSVETPTVRWYWNIEERIAVAPGIACFGAGNAYAHGGVSLQECLTPVIRVTGGKPPASVTAAITLATWAGLRCRVRVEPTQPGWSVDLRGNVNDPASSIDRPRGLDSDGNASLLVADDGLEGSSAVLVLLDAGGRVIARRSTIIGGED